MLRTDWTVKATKQWRLAWCWRTDFPFIARKTFGPGKGDFGWYKFGPLFIDWERTE